MCLYNAFTLCKLSMHSLCLFVHLSFPMERLYILGEVADSLIHEKLLFSVVKDMDYFYEYRKIL